VKLAILTTAALMLLNCVNAQAHVAKKYINDAPATLGAAPPTELAMGPTSAPHLPGGPVNGPTSSSQCTDAPDTCPPPHKKTKHPSKHSSSL
jgi:hypothetical protein